METKQGIIAGMEDVEQRFERLLPAIRENLDHPLLHGTWTIHDTLCHLAADADAVHRWRIRVDAALGGTSARPPGFNLDEHNQTHIELRKSRPIDEVVKEFRDGLHADMAEVAGLDDDQLAREIPNARGEVAPASELLRFTTGGHNQVHLDDIEKALEAAATQQQER